MVNLYSSGYQGSGILYKILNYNFPDLTIIRHQDHNMPMSEKNIYLFKDPRDTYFSIIECNNRKTFESNSLRQQYTFIGLIKYMETIWKPMHDFLYNKENVHTIRYETIFLDYEAILINLGKYLNKEPKNKIEPLWLYKNGQYYNRRINCYKSFMSKEDNDAFSQRYANYINDINLNKIWFED